MYIQVEKDTYQNGAFWSVATGWFYDAHREYDLELAERTIADVLEFFEKYGVFECICGEYKKLDTYVVSSTNVYAAVRKIIVSKRARELKSIWFNVIREESRL